jgi:hypothetical protein
MGRNVFPKECPFCKREYEEKGMLVLCRNLLGVSKTTAGMREFSIPEGVESVYMLHTYGLPDGIRKITLPSSLRIIEDTAFMGWKNLSEINIPEGVVSIGSNAFAGTKIESLLIPRSVREIHEQAFNDMKSLRAVRFASGSDPKTIKGYPWRMKSGVTTL